MLFRSIYDNRNISFFKIRNTKCKKDFYIITKDCYATVGDDFVLNVKPVEDPTEQTYTTVYGDDLDGSCYFEIVN